MREGVPVASTASTRPLVRPAGARVASPVTVVEAVPWAGTVSVASASVTTPSGAPVTESRTTVSVPEELA